MPPVLAGLIGAAVALSVVLFVWMLRRGRETWRQLEARQQAERVAQELSDVIDTIPDAAMIVGEHDEILTVNDAANTLGLARGNRVGFPELLEEVRKVRAIQEPFRGTVVRELYPGAERLELSCGLQPLPQEKVFVVAQDESSHKRVEAVRRDFVANISHELKTPIGAMSVLAEAIEAAKDDPESVARFVGRLQMENSRLAELVNQIIDLSRLQSSDPMLTREVLDVTEVINEAVSRSREKATQREVQLIVAHTERAYILGDRWQLADAVTNLVQNAINYSDERARVTLSVLTVTADGDEFVEIKVSDNGIGIAADEQERIFERFYRVDYGRSRQSGGTGLGLSIVRHIAAAHGGTIRVWSRPGQGSTFTLRLPAYLGTDLEEEDDPS
ncbi:MAG TPA: two-component sensor histidine kinase [Tessaracoccus flavescens]|uniref:Sensor-like histidine kinase SenX3 n=1 Tax=Tessaracoccus flavescens TaxID=399497 RepID=A0A921ES76_9ACTN|nr:two-component sensor histidine kinase [Tessaracoccus flavescens]